jgi:hypothetical protein
MHKLLYLAEAPQRRSGSSRRDVVRGCRNRDSESICAVMVLLARDGRAGLEVPAWSAEEFAWMSALCGIMIRPQILAQYLGPGYSFFSVREKKLSWIRTEENNDRHQTNDRVVWIFFLHGPAMKKNLDLRLFWGDRQDLQFEIGHGGVTRD